MAQFLAESRPLQTLDILDLENEAGWTPYVIAKGVFRTATYKEAPHTATLLEELMQARAQPQ